MRDQVSRSKEHVGTLPEGYLTTVVKMAMTHRGFEGETPLTSKEVALVKKAIADFSPRVGTNSKHMFEEDTIQLHIQLQPWARIELRRWGWVVKGLPAAIAAVDALLDFRAMTFSTHLDKKNKN
ncbi:unnamed protein product [Citrullus colocynthis]|uniref:Uncharacterized protein n=1 Tax=Citrullus colocynthis TaxID=252529 RepID=A0ABP0YTQ1_9ROSI